MAFSNVCLANLGSAGAGGSAVDFLYYFGLYASCLFVANVPEMASNYQLTKAKLRSLNNYTKEFALTHQNSPELTLESKVRAEKEPWLTGRVKKLVEESLTMIHGSAAMTLGSIFTIGTLTVIHYLLKAHYWLFVKFIINAIFVKSFQKAIRKCCH